MPFSAAKNLEGRSAPEKIGHVSANPFVFSLGWCPCGRRARCLVRDSKIIDVIKVEARGLLV